jgi:hypothetical protein
MHILKSSSVALVCGISLKLVFSDMEDRFCGLKIRVFGYGCRGSWFDSQRYQIF